MESKQETDLEEHMNKRAMLKRIGKWTAIGGGALIGGEIVLREVLKDTKPNPDLLPPITFPIEHESTTYSLGGEKGTFYFIYG